MGWLDLAPKWIVDGIGEGLGYRELVKVTHDSHYRVQEYKPPRQSQENVEKDLWHCDHLLPAMGLLPVWELDCPDLFTPSILWDFCLGN